MFAILLRGKKISFEHPIKRSFKNAGRLGFDRISDVTAASQLTMCWCETYWPCVRDEMISVRSCLVLVSLLAELASSNDARYEALLITNTVPIYPAFKRKYSTRTPSLIWWREKKAEAFSCSFFLSFFLTIERIQKVRWNCFPRLVSVAWLGYSLAFVLLGLFYAINLRWWIFKRRQSFIKYTATKQPKGRKGAQKKQKTGKTTTPQPRKTMLVSFVMYVTDVLSTKCYHGHVI